MASINLSRRTRALARTTTILAAGALAVSGTTASAQQPTAFGPANPFYAPSTLPHQAPPFDKIHNTDYQPAIEAGIAQQRTEIEAIANSTTPATFDNTIVAMERSGQLLNRVMLVFSGVTQANTNDLLQKVQDIETPKLAAAQDAIYLNTKLFARVHKLYSERATLKLDPESLRLLEYDYQQFVKAGANLSEADKTKLKKLNEEDATLSNDFMNKLLAAAKAGAYVTTDKSVLAGLTDAQISAAALSAKDTKQQGFRIPLQNTTQQPDLAELTNRATRQAIFENSITRTERNDANDTRATISRLAQLRAEKAHLLGFPNYAAWTLQDQMAKTPEAALKLKPWDWNFYSEQVRKAKYDLDENEVKPYFELDRVLQDGVFYAANQLYGLTFKERHDLPVYNPDVRVFEVFDINGKTLALAYFDYFKRDNKQGGAWMSNFVNQSKLLGTIPVIYNVGNFAKPAPGEPALISFDDVTTMFHEFGHGLHGIFANTVYPSLSGTSVPRDFVEFPSQFNEHWASNPQVFAHFAKHYKTGAPMPAELAAKIKKAATFNEGYRLTELLAAAELDMQWHSLPNTASLQNVDDFEKSALARTHLNLETVPPRYRSSYFLHIWANGYSAGYYAYLWTEMLDDDAYQWFEDHGGLTRANGDRFRNMVLSRGNTEDLDKMYSTWLGAEPDTKPMLKDRGLVETSPVK